MRRSDLRVLICEDEFLLASNLASEMEMHGVTVIGTASRVADVEAALANPDFDANAAVLDVQLLDGPSYSLLHPMLDRGMAVVFCTGYGPSDLPHEVAHVPSVVKPTSVELILEALDRAPRNTHGEAR